MSIINFSLPTALEHQVKKTIKAKGFASKAEFFRFAAIYFLNSIDQSAKLDELIAEAQGDYQRHNYKTFTTASGLLRELKS